MFDKLLDYSSKFKSWRKIIFENREQLPIKKKNIHINMQRRRRDRHIFYNIL